MSTFPSRKGSSCLRRRRSLTVFGIILFGLALSGCSDNLLEPSEIYSWPYASVRPMQAEWPVGLELVLPERVKEGTTITFRMILTNLGDETIEIHRGGNEFDIVVTRPDGSLIWERLFGYDQNMSLIMTPLQPGDTLQWEIKWNQGDLRGRRVSPGALQARGILLGNMAGRSGYLLTEPVEFTVVEQQGAYQ